MFTKILIANRGEIACRIIRTAKRLGIQCVAVYSEADANALHVKLADEAYCIGPAPSKESYLNADKIIATALACGAQAIHPGYGFLSENADFATKCAKAHLIFIGPPPAAIAAMGSKSAAKTIMEKAKIPLVPGYHGDNQDVNFLQKQAEKIGYPILLKAAAGGGGKGMRIVWQAQEFVTALAGAKREALSSFGNDEILLEKYLTNPRHVEIQVFADSKGNCVHLFERDCSIQRRHQKIIEEAPAPGLSSKIREAMGKAAIEAARAIKYVGAGTVEFLLNGKDFYFMEMNTRLQVEHPVTEMITGVDLVEWQFKIAVGEPLPLQQKQLKINGHAFETRIYAEDPQNGFLPSTGVIKYLSTPAQSEFVRLDSGVEQHDIVTPFYDPMLAKLIVWGEDRKTALNQLISALADYQIVGPKTNLELLTRIAQHPAFIAEEISTHFIDKYQHDLLDHLPINDTIIAITSLFYLLKQTEIAYKQDLDPYSPWQHVDSWRVNLPPTQSIHLQFGEQSIEVIAEHQAQHYSLKISDNKFTISGEFETTYNLLAHIDNETYHVNVYSDKNYLYLLSAGKRYQIKIAASQDEYSAPKHDHKASLAAPMPGKVVALLADTGKRVEQGQALAIVEAMKMEHTINAPYTGIVQEWFFNAGDLVDEGKELLAFERLPE